MRVEARSRKCLFIRNPFKNYVLINQPGQQPGGQLSSLNHLMVRGSGMSNGFQKNDQKAQVGMPREGGA